MNRERIEETVRLWQAQPDKAKGKPMVIARAEGSKAVMELRHRRRSRFRLSLYPRSRTRRVDGSAGVSGGYNRPPGRQFGPGDALFGTLAELTRWLPALPLIGGGATRLQPVFVEDVAEAVAKILTDPGSVGQTYELAGPGVHTLRELVSMTVRYMGKRRLLVSIPFAVAEIQARLFELLPNPPLTTGQVDLLKADNVASGALPGLQDLKIRPKTVEEVVPTYIGP